MVKITCGDIFCGGGGWTARMPDLLSPIWAIDSDNSAIATHSRNFPNCRAICDDIARLDPR